MSNEDDDDFGLTEAEFLWVEFAKGALAVLSDPTVKLVPDFDDPKYPNSATAIAADAATLMLGEFEKRFRQEPEVEETPAPAIDPSLLS